MNSRKRKLEVQIYTIASGHPSGGILDFFFHFSFFKVLFLKMDMSLSGFAILWVENQGWLVLRHLTNGSESVRNLGDVAHWDIHLRILFPTYELSKKKARSTNLQDSLRPPQWGIFFFKVLFLKMDMSLSGFAILRVENQGWLVLRHLTKFKRRRSGFVTEFAYQ